MQTDEEVGKVAQAVPVIISRTLELFVESLLTKTLRITNARNAKTLSPSHMKQCIISESRFDFLRDLVKNIPDIGVNEEQHSGSEAGYGNEAAVSPASTSTSSSSNGGGGSGFIANAASSSNEASSIGANVSGNLLQRSESYSTSGTNYASALQTSTQVSSQPQTHSLKRGLNHTNSLNFYKEIPLDDSSGSATVINSREPPPKLTRLHSAPAASITTSSVPFKIDILPTLAASSNNTNPQQIQKGNSGSSANNSSNYKITYNIEPLTPGTSGSNASVTTKTHDAPVIKLDYSKLKLPMTMSSSEPPQLHTTKPSSHTRQQQPTIKIDLSNITNFSSKLQPQSPVTLIAGSAINMKQVPSTPTASTPSTPLSALSSASSSASSSSCGGVKSPYIFQHSPALVGSSFAPTSSTNSSLSATAISSSSGGPPMQFYSGATSTVPDMDEDYDDI
ncbi:dr1-associated corepressor homolog isoform X2 [Malaya genurostris]|nr:dr1-associated corepressor homolog isoform X2 [Malaya genurostris]